MEVSLNALAQDGCTPVHFRNRRIAEMAVGGGEGKTPAVSQMKLRRVARHEARATRERLEISELQQVSRWLLFGRKGTWLIFDPSMR